MKMMMEYYHDELINLLVLLKEKMEHATTDELVETLKKREGVRVIETSEEERSQISVTTGGEFPVYEQSSKGSLGPEVIIRYRKGQNK